MANENAEKSRIDRPEFDEQVRRLADMFSSPQFVKMMHVLKDCDPEDRESLVRKWADPVILEGMGIPIAKGATITARYFFEDPKIEGVFRRSTLPGQKMPDIGPVALCGGIGAPIGCACFGT